MATTNITQFAPAELLQSPTTASVQKINPHSNGFEQLVKQQNKHRPQMPINLNQSIKSQSKTLPERSQKTVDKQSIHHQKSFNVKMNSRQIFENKTSQQVTKTAVSKLNTCLIPDDNFENTQTNLVKTLDLDKRLWKCAQPMVDDTDVSFEQFDSRMEDVLLLSSVSYLPQNLQSTPLVTDHEDSQICQDVKIFVTDQLPHEDYVQDQITDQKSILSQMNSMTADTYNVDDINSLSHGQIDDTNSSTTVKNDTSRAILQTKDFDQTLSTTDDVRHIEQQVTRNSHFNDPYPTFFEDDFTYESVKSQSDAATFDDRNFQQAVQMVLNTDLEQYNQQDLQDLQDLQDQVSGPSQKIQQDLSTVKLENDVSHPTSSTNRYEIDSNPLQEMKDLKADDSSNEKEQLVQEKNEKQDTSSSQSEQHSDKDNLHLQKADNRPFIRPMTTGKPVLPSDVQSHQDIKSEAIQFTVLNSQKLTNDSSGRMTIQLSPINLGKIEVDIRTTMDGRFDAVVRVESADTLRLLQQDQKELQRVIADAFQTDTNAMNFNLSQQNKQQDSSALYALQEQMRVTDVANQNTSVDTNQHRNIKGHIDTARALDQLI